MTDLKYKYKDGRCVSIGNQLEMPVKAVEYKMTKNQILKNIFIISFAFMFLFTAFQSMSNLQSSLNKEENLGTGGLSIIYGALIVSCIFLPTILIAFLGCKWTIVASMICYVLYMAAQFYASWPLIAPASVVIGLGAAPLWSAKCTYLTETGDWYAKMASQDRNAIINRFFGIFYMLFQTSQIWGNLISSTVLATEVDGNNTVNRFECGANWCPTESDNSTGLGNPDYHKIYTMLGIYLAFACIAVFIIVIFLDKIVLDKEEHSKIKPSVKLLIATFRHIWQSPHQKMLVPLTIYSGIELTFIGADYTRSFITCIFGVWNVGYVMICYGVTAAICSFLFGRLVQYVGRITFFIFAAVLHLGVQITLLLWIPDPDMVIIFYVLAALWGMGDAIWQTQINALYGYLFKSNSEPAFANYQLWQSVGFIIAFAYSGFLCTHVKLYICIGILALGMLGYISMEIYEHRGISHDLKHDNEKFL